MPVIENFGRNVHFRPKHWYAPRSDEEVLEILRRHRGERIRSAGGLHSWSRILASDGVLLDMRYFDSVGIVTMGTGPKREGARVRLGAGCTIKRVLALLEPHGLTLPTLGAITRQTIAGAISTGTHGSGKPSLSHFVEEVRLAGYDPATGEPIIRRFRGREELRAARCALGGLGVILDVVMRASKSYRVRERFEKVATLAEATAMRAKWPLQQFFLVPWKWRYFVYRRKRTLLPHSRLCALLLRIWLLVSIDFAQHWILRCMVLPLARVAGDWVIRLFLCGTPIFGHRRIDDSQHVLTLRHDLLRHVEMEVFVRESELAPAIDSIRGLIELAAGRVTPGAAALEPRVPGLRGTWTHHYPVSFRYVLPDDTLVSMASKAFEGDTESWVAISFFTYALPISAAFEGFAFAVARLLIAQHRARLHWGKYFPLPFRDAVKSYPRFAEFEAICRRYDPDPVRAFWSENL